MMSTTLSLNWTGGKQGSGQIEGKDFSAAISIPESLGGAGTGSNPKELYVASTAACFLATLSAISEGKKLPVEALNVQTEAEETKDSFTITHHATLTLKAEATEEDQAKAKEIVAAADKMCAVGNMARKAGVEISVTTQVN
ncbi:OsmC family protein [Pokkaliibacter sp. CJK22405]|uniref:OsmC family protein n=1 Tax=Pokkaliibacter sp. CJK22405 TaxID=3384615 RepID=UPI003984E69B